MVSTTSYCSLFFTVLKNNVNGRTDFRDNLTFQVQKLKISLTTMQN